MDVLYTDYNRCLGSKDDQIIYRTTKIGDVTVSQWKTVPEGAPGMPPIPVSYQGDTAISNSDALRAWVEGPAPSGSGNMLDYFIVDNFGQDIWNQTFGSKDYKQFKVVFEPLFWFRPVNAQKQILNSTQGGKTWVYGTSWNIAQWENSCLEWIGNNTGGWMKNATNKLFPTSFYLSTSDSELGLKTPSKLGLLTTEELLDYSQGYGMHIYSREAGIEKTHTWDYALGAEPGKAPKMDPIEKYQNTLRPVTIVKVYETISTDVFGESTIQLDGVFSREENCRYIQVENEENYRVEGYFK